MQIISRILFTSVLAIGFAISAFAQDQEKPQQTLFNNINIFDGKSEKLA